MWEQQSSVPIKNTSSDGDPEEVRMERTLIYSGRGESLNLLHNNKGRTAFNGSSFNPSTKALLFESEDVSFYNLQLFLSE